MACSLLNYSAGQTEIAGDPAAGRLGNVQPICRRSSNMKKHALLFSASLLASALIVPLSSSLVFAHAASDTPIPDTRA
jgi:hypothetical protein